MRNVLSIDCRIHQFSIEAFSKQEDPKVMLISRLVRFYRAQIDSPKFHVRFLVRLDENDK